MSNWNPFAEETIRSAESVATPLAFRTLGEGWGALAQAARVGAFILVHWRARKPASAETLQVA
jgi:hypothetical protein